MYAMMQHAHSGFRWVVLICLLYAIYNNLTKWRGGKSFEAGDLKLNTFTVRFVHIQFLLGLILYFISPKVNFAAESMKEAASRFFLVEHSVMMIIAIALITIGNVKSKKATVDASKFKLAFWFFLIGLLIMLISIPWPPRFGAGWF